jgi:hypothetical protein
MDNRRSQKCHHEGICLASAWKRAERPAKQPKELKMANQDFNDPQERERQRLEAERDLRDRRAVAGGGWFAWWWIWFIVVIGLIVWFAGWGWIGYGGWGGGNRRAVSVQPNNAQGGAIVISVNVPQLLKNPQTYEGKRVLLPDATVQQVVNQRAAWVGPSDNEKILVIATNSPEKLTQGEKVDVSGTAAAPANNQGQQNLGLSAADNNQVKNEGVIVEAAAFTPPGQMRTQGHGPTENQNR